MLPNRSLGEVGEPDSGFALGHDPLGRAEDHEAIARVLRERLDLIVKVKILALYLPERDTSLYEPPLGFFLRFRPTHLPTLGILMGVAS